MLGHSARPLVRLLTAFFFALSMIAQGQLPTEANARMSAPATGMAMSSADEPMDCGGEQEANRGNCIAACVGVIGILSDVPAVLIVASLSGTTKRLTESLSDRSIPPNPYPPRPSALI